MIGVIFIHPPQDQPHQSTGKICLLSKLKFQFGKINFLLKISVSGNVSATWCTPLPRGINSISGNYQLDKKSASCNGTHSVNVSLNPHTTHEGKKPFNCITCDTFFSGNENLKDHVASVHEGKKPFKCQYSDHNCGQYCDMQ